MGAEKKLARSRGHTRHGQGTGGRGQGAGDRGQGTRDKGQGTRDRHAGGPGENTVPLKSADAPRPDWLGGSVTSIPSITPKSRREQMAPPPFPSSSARPSRAVLVCFASN